MKNLNEIYGLVKQLLKTFQTFM